MAAVWWLRDSTRVFSSADWLVHGITAATSTWDKSNGWSLPRASFTSPQLAILDAETGFDTNSPDGPRPGGGVPTMDEDLVRESDVFDGSGNFLEQKLPDRLAQTVLDSSYIGVVNRAGNPVPTKRVTAVLDSFGDIEDFITKEI